LQKYNKRVCPKKSGPFHWLGVDLNFSKILGHTWDPVGSPRGNSLISIGMGGPEKKRVFSDFAMNAVLHKEISKEESGKSFDSTSTSKI
jgi:hypothetical protein